MISILYDGPHYSMIEGYKNEIEKNHIAFANFNKIQYKLYGEEILKKYNLLRVHDNKQINVASFMPGIGKLYACLQAQKDFPNAKYIMFVDFDSLFIKEKNIEDVDNFVSDKTFRDNKITRSTQQFAYLYDMSYLYYYCIYKEHKYDQINQLHYRYNSGLFVIERNVFSCTQIDEYVDFSYDIFLKKSNFVESKENHMTMSFSKCKNAEHQLFHPSDEVFWQWLTIANPCDVSVFKHSWNYIGSPWESTENMTTEQCNKFINNHDLYHVHCIKKQDLKHWLEHGVLQ